MGGGRGKEGIVRACTKDLSGALFEYSDGDIGGIVERPRLLLLYLTCSTVSKSKP